MSLLHACSLILINCLIYRRNNIFVGIEGFIKAEFQSVVNGNCSYGCGAITDGFHRLIINITEFNKTLRIPLGHSVIVTGKLRNNRYGTIILQIPNMKNVKPSLKKNF